MRLGLMAAVLFLAACAGEKLALAPPPGVNFSGRWTLNAADSDDPQRVAMSQNAGPANAQTAGSGGQGGQGGQGGGRGGGRGGRGGPGGPGGAGALGNGGPAGPAMPGVGALSDGLRWPGKDLEIRQSAGVVTMTSAAITQVYQPVAGAKPRHPKESASAAGAPQGRDAPGRDRGARPPPVCGWDDKTLVVTSDNPDDDRPPFEERYSLSEDGQRLIEVVAFKGGRSGGFTVSRVWDRMAQSPPQ